MATFSFPWYTYVLFAVGVLVGVGGAISAIARALWLLRAERTTGVVFDNKTHATKQNAVPRYHPRVRYEVPSGQAYTLTSQVSWGKPPYEKGTAIPVVYDPRAPERAEIASFVNLWMLPLMSVTFALVP